MYVMCCPCCAAGDIARAAGRDYCMSCFVIPFCLGFIQPCWWSYDRQALAARLGIEDPFSGSGESLLAYSTSATLSSQITPCAGGVSLPSWLAQWCLSRWIHARRHSNLDRTRLLPQQLGLQSCPPVFPRICSLPALLLRLRHVPALPGAEHDQGRHCSRPAHSRRRSGRHHHHHRRHRLAPAADDGRRACRRCTRLLSRLAEAVHAFILATHIHILRHAPAPTRVGGSTLPPLGLA